MQIKAYNNRVIIKKDTPEEMTKGGIVIPDVCKEKPMSGTVIDVREVYINTRGYKIQTDLKVGDKVLFGKYSGVNAKIRGEEVFIVEAKDVLAVKES